MNTYSTVEYYPCELSILAIGQYFENCFGFTPTREQIISFCIYSINAGAVEYVKGTFYKKMYKVSVELPKKHTDRIEEIYLKNPTIKNKALLLTLIINTRATTLPELPDHVKKN
jgi:hypothetical protein